MSGEEYKEIMGECVRENECVCECVRVRNIKATVTVKKIKEKEKKKGRGGCRMTGDCTWLRESFRPHTRSVGRGG